MTIFAEAESLHELVRIARREQRERSNSSGSNRRTRRTSDAIEVSDSSWSVLVIESHEEDVGASICRFGLYPAFSNGHHFFELGDSGARVREISTLLADAGISILYQSSYMSDFILVRSAPPPSEAFNQFLITFEGSDGACQRGDWIIMHIWILILLDKSRKFYFTNVHN